MSELTLFGNSKIELPSHLQGLELDETTKSLMGTGGGKRISIRGSVFRMVVNGEEMAKREERNLDVVIVRAAEHVSRTYYDGEYSEGDSEAPRCWSADGVTPDESVSSPMSSACANCPMNIAGSGQGESRACRFSHRIAVVVDGDLEGNIYQMSLPAKSLFGKNDKGGMPLQQYVRLLAGHGLPVTAVVTEMKFDTESSTPKLFFKAKRPLSLEEFELAKSQGETQDAIDAVTYTVYKMDGGDDGEEFETSEAEDETLAEAAKTVKTAAKKAVAKKAAAKKAAAKKPEPEAEPEEAEDGDDEDDELAALERKMAELKAAKAAKASKGVTKRESKPKEEAPVDAESIMQEWADDSFDD